MFFMFFLQNLMIDYAYQQHFFINGRDEDNKNMFATLI